MTAIRSSNLRLQTRNVRKLGPCQAMFLYWKSAHTLELKIRQGPGKSKIKISYTNEELTLKRTSTYADERQMIDMIGMVLAMTLLKQDLVRI